MRSANGSSSERPTTAWQATPSLPAARGHLARDLPLEALLVEAALAGDHEGRGAHEAVEAEGVQHERRRRERAAPRAPPRALPRGRRRRRSSARRAGSRGQVPASLASRRSSRFTIAGSAPFCGANTRGASSNGVRTSHTTSRSTSTPASSSASSAPAPPSVVAEPPTRHHHPLGAGRHGGRDQLAGAARARAPGIAFVLVHEPEPARACRLHERRAAVRQQRELRARPGGRADRSRSRSGARRRVWPGARPSCPRRRRPPAAPRPRGPPLRSPVAMAAATSAAPKVPLKLSGATSAGPLTARR